MEFKSINFVLSNYLIISPIIYVETYLLIVFSLRPICYFSLTYHLLSLIIIWPQILLAGETHVNPVIVMI